MLLVLEGAENLICKSARLESPALQKLLIGLNADDLNQTKVETLSCTLTGNKTFDAFLSEITTPKLRRKNWPARFRAAPPTKQPQQSVAACSHACSDAVFLTAVSVTLDDRQREWQRGMKYTVSSFDSCSCLALTLPPIVPFLLDVAALRFIYLPICFIHIPFHLLPADSLSSIFSVEVFFPHTPFLAPHALLALFPDLGHF